MSVQTRAERGPLDGIVVADFTRVLAGPYCTMLLADMGAAVIKVESPEGDETRTWRPPVLHGEATYYLSVNRNKQSIVLDLADPADLATAQQIAGRADVVIENFKPGGLARFGLDHEAVAQGNPSVVYCSITGFGSGAGADLPGYDLLIQAMSGLMDLTGDAEGEPTKTGVAIVDVVTGLHAATGILAALHHRTATGEGQRVQVNLLTSALSALVNQSGAAAMSDVTPTRMGNAHPSIYPYEPLPTADGLLVLAVGNDRQFQRLCAAVGMPGVADDARFTSNEDRSTNRVALRRLLVDAMAGRTAAEWHEVLAEAGVPCGPINDIQGGLALAERLGLAPIVQAGEGAAQVPSVRNPIEFSATPPRYTRPPPALGADGDAVRAWLAGP